MSAAFSKAGASARKDIPNSWANAESLRGAAFEKISGKRPKGKKAGAGEGDAAYALGSQDFLDLRMEVFNLANEERRKEFVPKLQWDGALADAAQLRAAELTELFDHTRPNGKDFHTALGKNFSRKKRYAENIAMGDRFEPVDAVDGWMHSKGHKLNMLSISYTKIGIGAVRLGRSTYYVQLFSN